MPWPLALLEISKYQHTMDFSKLHFPTRHRGGIIQLAWHGGLESEALTEASIGHVTLFGQGHRLDI